MTAEKQTVFDWIDQHRAELSEQHLTVWNFAEPAWREYRSAAFFVDVLRKAGFDVEAGSATMPTAFCATFGRGKPVLGAYAEYDAVPGMSQAPVTYRKPRDGFHRSAAGHTDPHSALGIGALAGVLGAKAAMERHRLPGTIKFFGEPAEKVCGSKPVHAAHGYYDDLDAAISFHPDVAARRSPTRRCGTRTAARTGARSTRSSARSPQTWGSAGSREGTNNSHTTARAPAALDAVCLMYTTTKYTKESMLPHRGTWTLNEFILVAGQATSDNLAPTFSQIQYSWRCPSLEMAERILDVLEQNARHVAAITHCQVSSELGDADAGRPAQSRDGGDHLSEPRAGGTARRSARRRRSSRGRSRRRSTWSPMDDPFMPEISELTPPRSARRGFASRSRPGRRTTPPTTTSSTRGTRRPRACTSAARCCGRRGPTTAIPTGRATPSAASRPPSIRCGTRPGAPSAPRWSS